MALLFMDGFDDGQIAARGWTRSTNAVAGRLGGLALDTGSFPSGASIYYFATPLVGTLVIGCAINALSKGVGFLAFGSMTLGTNGSGALTLSNGNTFVSGTTTNYFAGNVWRYVEAKYVLSTGAVTVCLDGVTVLTGTVAVNTSITYMTFGPGQDRIYVDDLYILDTTGTTNNNFLGDVRIQTLFPSADGTYSELSPSTGTAHAVLVDEAVPNTTDYVSSSTAGTRDTYQFQDLSTNTASVFAVEVTNYAQKDAAGPAGIANIARVGGSNYLSPAKGLPTSWIGNRDVLELNPATGLPWAAADINNAEFGVQVT